MLRGCKIAIIPLLLTLNACLTTGVESLQRVPPPPQQHRNTADEVTHLLQDVVGEPPASWMPGKRFRVTDARLSQALRYGVPLAAGDDITFVSFAPRTDIAGRQVTDIRLRDPRGRILEYPTGLSPQALQERPSYAIPFAVEYSLVAAADSLLRHRTLWPRTRLWRNADGSAVSHATRRYVQVVVDSVAPGRDDAPLRVDFTETSTGARGSLFVTLDTRHGATATFDALFYTADPWQHIDWDEATRVLICAGRTAPGMTRAQVRMSLGAPATVTHPNTHSLLRERWVYPDGRTLLFEEDRLLP